MNYDEFLACHAWLRRRFKAATDQRHGHPGNEWEEYERVELAIAANSWADSHGLGKTVTRDDIEAIEGQAIGHVDYASKLCLYTAELLYDRHVGHALPTVKA